MKCMNRPLITGIFFLLALLVHDADARKKKFVEDAFAEIESEDEGVQVWRNRSVFDYDAVAQMKAADPSLTRILVTTDTPVPGGDLYPVAEAVAESLRAKFPLTDFRVVGRAAPDDLAEVVRRDYDQIFIVTVSSDSRSYESERTVYGSRTTGVTCTPTALGAGVTCRESSTGSFPIGNRTVRRSRYSETFKVAYGPAVGAYVARRVVGDGMTIHMANRQEAGITAVSISYGTDDDSWCDNSTGALTYLARIVSPSVVSTRPDERALFMAPDDIGCDP